MSDVHVEEFLYRGRAKSSDQPPAWHVVLAETGVDGFGKPFVHTSAPMSVAQAEGAGWPLSKVLEEINAEALKVVEAHGQHIDRIEGELQQARETIDNQANLIEQLEAQVASLTAQASE